MQLEEAIYQQIAVEMGQEPASWAALADRLDEIDQPQLARAARFLLTATLRARPGRRYSVERFVVRAASASPRSFLQGLAALLNDLAGPRETASAYRHVYKSIPYMGHHNVSRKQRQQLDRFTGIITRAGGYAPYGTLALMNSLHVVALAVAEALEE